MNQITDVINSEKTVETLLPDRVVSEKSLEASIELADKQVKLLEKVLEIAIRRTNERDWVDQQGNPYLTGSGAEKLMPLFGVSVLDVDYEKMKSEDDEGKYYIYQYKGKFIWRGSSIISIGTRSSRDKFFGWNSIDKTYKPDSQIDETNIMKSAYTNMLVNGITRLLGIRNLTWNMLSQSGLDKTKIAKVEYKNYKTDNPKDADSRKEIYEKLMDICGMDQIKAIAKLREITQFKGKDGLVAGVEATKDLRGKRLEVTHSKVLKAHEQFQSELRVNQ